MTHRWASDTRAWQDQPTLVGAERLHAMEKHGIQHWSPERWIAILGEEFGEACQEVNEMVLLQAAGVPGDDPRYRHRLKRLRHELAQTAAMAIHFLCDLDGYPIDTDHPGFPQLPELPVPGPDGWFHDEARWWETREA